MDANTGEPRDCDGFADWYVSSPVVRPRKRGSRDSCNTRLRVEPQFLHAGDVKHGSIRVSQRYFQAFWGFSWVISWERPCGSSWKTRSVFQGAVGAFCASTAPSASTGPVRGRQDGSQGGEPGVMSNWTAASSDCGRDDVHIRTADLYRPNARFTPERQRYQVLTPFGKLGYSPESHCQNRQEPGVGISPPGPLRRHDLLDRR